MSLRLSHMVATSAITPSFSKIWGLMMAGTMIALLGFGVSNWFMDLTIVWGICCNVRV